MTVSYTAALSALSWKRENDIFINVMELEIAGHNESFAFVADLTKLKFRINVKNF